MTYNMKQKMVVVYLRVSTKKQAEDPTSLPAQRKLVLDFCEKQGWNVVAIFVDAGETAYKVDKPTDRPKFGEMLQYCGAHRHEIDYVVFENASRFSRRLLHSELAVEQIERHGVGYWSVCDSGVNSDDPNGRYNLQGQIREAENFSRQLSRKMSDRALASLLIGRWSRGAPIGYANADRKLASANIIPDSQADHVRKAFELLSAGFHTPEKVRQIVNADGLQTKRGKPVSAQAFHKVLRNPIYCGRLVSRKYDKTVKGLHEPLIPEELFERVQRILSGKPVAAVTLKRKLNPALPLKNFVRCGECGTKLTGGFARSKSGTRYGYYWCRNKDCRAVKSVPNAMMEAEFKAQLKRLKPTEDTWLSFPPIAYKLWAETQGDVEKRSTKINAQLVEAKRQKAALLKMRLNQELSREEFEEANNEYAQQIATLEDQIQALEFTSAKQEAFMRFVELRLMDVAGAWDKAGPESRQRVQSLLYSDGLSYDPKSGSLNTAKSTLFQNLTQQEGQIIKFGAGDGI